MVENDAQPKILVLGDLIIDEYIYGRCHRISPEAPVPVVTFERSITAQGGAGNVAENLKSIGAEVKLWCIEKVCHKMRIIAGSQQVARLDRDDVTKLAPPEQLAEWVEWADLVIVSDYNKGAITPELIDELDKLVASTKKPIFVDPYNGKSRYGSNVTLIKPNRSEAESVVGFSISGYESLVAAGQMYLEKSGAENCIITLGSEGMALFDKHAYWESPYRVGTRVQQVFDVTGAGDTSIAVMAYSWAARQPSRWSKIKALMLANYAAGTVCSKLGTATVGYEEIFGN